MDQPIFNNPDVSFRFQVSIDGEFKVNHIKAVYCARMPGMKGIQNFGIFNNIYDIHNKCIEKQVFYIGPHKWNLYIKVKRVQNVADLSFNFVGQGGN